MSRSPRLRLFNLTLPSRTFRIDSRFRAHLASPPSWLAPALLAATLIPASAAMAGVSFPTALRQGAIDMQDSRSAAVLVTYFESFLKSQDIDLFLASIAARYTEGTLCRLVDSSDIQARRASIMALGNIGSFECNGRVAAALRDSDPLVRELASHALWAIWFRADTPENNLALGEIRRLNAQGQHHQAIRLADELIRKAPRFAEAHNQRAIACFLLERFEDSITDCRKALELNPYHFGALSGMGQCYLSLNRTAEALEVFKRAERLQPHDQDLRQNVRRLESELGK